MDTVFLLLLGISILCIPVFIIWAIINLILRRPAKKRFAFAGISALVFVISIIGFALTADDPASKGPASTINETPIATEEPTVPESIIASEDVPSSSLDTTTLDKTEPTAEGSKQLQQDQRQLPLEEQAIQEAENKPLSENTQQHSEDEQEITESPQNFDFDNSSNFNTYDNSGQQQTSATYVLNTSSKKFHYPSCDSVKKIAPQNYATSNSSRDELIAQDYEPCGSCTPQTNSK